MNLIKFKIIKFLVIIFCNSFMVSSYATNSVNIPKIEFSNLTTSEYVTPETFLDGDIVKWNIWSDNLVDIKSGDITFDVVGYGGDTITGVKFVQLLKMAEERGVQVHMKVIGPSYSMHSFLVCAGTDYSILPSGSLMFHRMYILNTFFHGILEFKNYKIDSSQQIVEEYFLNLCVEKNILTAQNKVDILNGKNVLISVDSNGSIVRTTESPHEVFDSNCLSLFKFILNTFHWVLGFIVVIMWIRWYTK